MSDEEITIYTHCWRVFTRSVGMQFGDWESRRPRDIC